MIRKPNKKSRRDLGICLVLAALVCAVFGQTLGFGFSGYDDGLYLHENPQVRLGLLPEGISHAFTHRSIGLWDPLVTVSHMLAWELFGAEPAGHHLFNLLLHTASVILLFLVLRRMTGAPWRSGFVAALFAIHPLRVESVAWIAERKDVLSGLFFMLTLWAYERYARAPSRRRYLTMAGLFACGLMSKAMLVTVPFVLLLLDYWPLRRLFKSVPGKPDRSWPERRVILEKIPLVALSAAFSVGLMSTPSVEVNNEALEITPFLVRLREAPLGYVIYLRQLVMPSDLAVIYPHPEERWLRWWPAAIGLLLLLSIAAFLIRRRHPAAFVGWYWNLGMLVPVSGVVQISRHWMADHYTYLPQIGLGIAVTWTAADWSGKSRHRRVNLGLTAAIILACLVVTARRQTAHWRDSETLWNHTLSVNPSCWVAYNNLGNGRQQRGQLDEAVLSYRKALDMKSDYPHARFNLGNALRRMGQFKEALEQFETGLEIVSDPEALRQKVRLEEALAHFQKALENNAGNEEAYVSLGLTAQQEGRPEEARLHYQKAIEINPGNAEAHKNLGVLLGREGLLEEEMAHYQKALEINPDDAESLNNLAYVLAVSDREGLRNGAKAVELAQKASELSGGANPNILGTLAAAQAEAGNLSGAVETVGRAIGLADAQGDSRLVARLRRHLKQYQNGKSLMDGH